MASSLIENEKYQSPKTRSKSSSTNILDSLLPSASAPLAKKMRLNSNATIQNHHTMGDTTMEIIDQGSPMIDHRSLVIDDQSLVIDRSPVIDQSPIIDRSPTIDQSPIIDQSPTIDRSPIIDQSPIMDNVQSLLARSALSSLVFGSNGGQYENGAKLETDSNFDHSVAFENGGTFEHNDHQSSGESESPLFITSGRSSDLDGYEDLNAQFLINEQEEGEAPIPNGGNPDGANGSNYFACLLCNKYFWTETSLKHHSSLYHSEKSFVCEICAKAFRFRSNLAEHRSVHTSLKPYVCKFCGKSSRLKGNLTKHILKHHKKEQTDYIGKDDIIIKKGKKSIKDPAAVDFLEKSMIVLTSSTMNQIPISSAPASSTSGKHPTNVSSSNTNNVLQFPITGADLGSAAFQLLSMASKTETKSSSRSSKKHANQAKSASQTNGGNSRSKNEKSGTQQMQWDTNHLDNATVKYPIFGFSTLSNGKSSNKEPSRLAIPDAGFTTETKCEYEDILNAVHRNQIRGQVDVMFENLLGRNLGQPIGDTNVSRQTDNVSIFSTFQDSSPYESGITNVGTRCQLCGKHFRKTTNLTVHMSIKHGQTQSTGTPIINVQSPSPPRFDSDSKYLIGQQSISQQPKSISTQMATPIKTDSVSKFSQQSVTQSTNAIAQSLNRQCSTVGNSNSRHPVGLDTIAQSSSANAPSPQLDGSNGLMNKSGVSKDLKEIRSVLQEFKRGLPDVAKLDELLSALDARIDRLERQLETSVNTLFILVQMQSEMNSAFVQFKNDIVQRLKSLKSQHDNDRADENERRTGDIESTIIENGT